jgi:hypothetical protein
VYQGVKPDFLSLEGGFDRTRLNQGLVKRVCLGCRRGELDMYYISYFIGPERVRLSNNKQDVIDDERPV